MLVKSWKGPLHVAVAIMGFTALYALSAMVAHGTVAGVGISVPFWPSAGVALGAVLLYGPRLLIAAFVGQILANAGSGEALAMLVPAVAATVGAAAAWAVMRRLGGDRRVIDSLRQVLALVAAGIVGGSVAAISAVLWLAAARVMPPEGLSVAAETWAIGDAVGMVAVTPVVLALARTRRLSPRWAEWALLLALTAVVCAVVYGGQLPVSVESHAASWAVLPFAIWGALRLGVPGAATVGLVVALASAAFTAAGSGPFVGVEPSAFASLQLFIGMVTLTGLLLAAGEAERTAAVAEVRRLSSAVEQSAAGVVMMDTEGRLTYVNPRFTETSGWQPREVMGRTIESLGGGPTSDTDHAAMWQALRAGQTWHGELVNRRRDGSLGWEQASISPIRDERGQVTHFVAIKEDITERKEDERRLRTMVEELQRSNRELQHFAAIAAHDLQEPLRAISGFAQLLRKRYGERLDAEADSYIEFMVGGAEHMKAMFRDLLDYSQVDAVPVTPVDVDLGAVAVQVRDALEGEIEKNGAEVVLGPLPVVRGVRRQLELVLSHLIGNALKFRHPERRSRIMVGAVRRADAWEVHILDTGIGIAPDHLKSLFVLFRRLHTREAYGGTGIGLAISRRIVERHGGRIWAESDGETGTAIRFTLPLESAAVAPLCPSPATSAPKILEDLTA